MNEFSETTIAAPGARSARASGTTSMIEWSVSRPGLWVGRIGLDFAGLVEQASDGFLVTDWAGERLGTHSTLADAQRALEPAHRSFQRELAERAALRANALLSAGLVVLTLTAATAVGTWLTSTT